MNSKQNIIKQLPQAIDIEEAVLGILLLYPKKYIEVSHILSSEAFYKETHQLIYGAMSSLFGQSRPMDLLSVTDSLRKSNDLDKIGGAYYLTDLTDKASNTGSLEYYSNIILELYRKRLGIEQASNLIANLYDDSCDMVDNLSKANEVVYSLTNEITNVGGVTISHTLYDMLKEQENELRGDFFGCKSQFADLDRIVNGFKNQQVIVVAGRPGMGKTTFALNVVYRLAKFTKTPIGYFSLEMSAVELTKKFAAIESQMYNGRIKDMADKDVESYFKKTQGLADLPIFIDDKPVASIDDIRARAITMKRKHDIKFLVIDFLQLISSNKNKLGNREQEISEISRKVKLLAKELDIPIMELAQLSRAVESTESKVPQLHHLRESGSIEQDADIVLMLMRPEYYDIPEVGLSEESKMSSENKALLFIRKNRNGDTGRCLLECNLGLSSFYDFVDNRTIKNVF